MEDRFLCWGSFQFSEVEAASFAVRVWLVLMGLKLDKLVFVRAIQMMLMAVVKTDCHSQIIVPAPKP